MLRSAARCAAVFTPRLIDAYHELRPQPAYQQAFELIFVRLDEDASKQEKHVKEVSMPWPFR